MSTTTHLSPAQQTRMDAITRAIDTLDSAQVPFTFFASADEAGEGMTVLESQRLSYLPSTDMDALLKSSDISRRTIQMAALKRFSLGMKGGFCIYGEEGEPLAMIEQGRVRLIDNKAKPKVTA